LLRKSVQHAYTLPKKGLVAVLSAHTPSLSLKVAALVLVVTITGGIQALLVPEAAAARSSVRETAMASKPLKVVSVRSVLKLEARLP